MQIKFKKLRADAVVPIKAHPNDAGFDLFFCPELDQDTLDLKNRGLVITYPITEEVCFSARTGIALEIPKGYVGKIYARSSLCKKGIGIANHVGIIDSDYRGEIIVKLFRIFPTTNRFEERLQYGERFAQILFEKVLSVTLEESEELSATERGTGGFGSTGNGL